MRPELVVKTVPVDSDYLELHRVLQGAYQQAAAGKGSARHNLDKVPFEEQPIMWIEEYFKSFQLGQAVKKIHESQGMDPIKAIDELRGAINFIAAHILFLKRKT